MSAITASDFVAIVASNNPETLASCLQRSPDVVSGALPVVVVKDAPSMTVAYNRGLDRTTQSICVLVHQDVYLPRGWLDRAVSTLNELSRLHPDWEVAAPNGLSGTDMYGRVYDTAFQCETCEASAEHPVPATSFDELLLLLRRSPGYRFDEGLPGFHLYGTDIAQSAIVAGRGAYVVELPVVHNARLVSTLRGDYARAWWYARRKWWHHLPIQTSVSRLSRNPLDLWRAQWAMRNRPDRTDDPLPDAVLAARLAGYE